MKSFGQRLKSIFSAKIDEEFFENMEDLLVESDLGALLSMEISDKLRESCKKKSIKNLDGLKGELRNILSDYVIEDSLKVKPGELNLFLFLGVNGVGKTTTIGRLAHYFKTKESVKDIVLSAGDTFRAAAIDQLKIHGERTNCRVVSQQHGADPGAVIFDTVKSAKSKGEELILADTAGRMHNKTNLIKELEKINKIVLNAVDKANYKKILVVDCTTGQNGLNQALQFNEAVKIDGVVLTKYDSSAKGGIIPAICNRLNIPFYFIGTGEGLDDIKPFNKVEYIKELIGV
ncbi:signal recognition particle-docking protein FtsY [Thiospirochaeta perfilievii]|uniref:Signal recognition particle receptor FtsY n=1 Tax=Thiospirochaeta perfilievii TaxID=252967 RepID=A0A5C1QAV9_9SPIO|nr:signal recognition particle-docking protein FtsY [Thiospirochaeta perfilievii]QEN03794.1 signal recognition particle-docking protein FtsY [Thiospirochaeta perfilievii]